MSPLSIARLTLTDFRNYAHAVIEAGPGPVVLTGANGSGKTNLLEAVSLLAPGQGLRRAHYPELSRQGSAGGWAVAARVHTRDGLMDIGTGLQPTSPGQSARSSTASGRIVRIGGEATTGSGALADLVEVVWVTPAMDGLFTGAAADRRRFLDRLVLCFDPGFRTLAGRYERAMQSRNRLLADGIREHARLVGVEIVMAEAGTAIAAARRSTVDRLARVIAARRDRDPNSPFPWAGLALEGSLEEALASLPAVDVEDAYARRLAHARERDRASGRTLEGPHRSDLSVTHGPKQMPARLSSTGEQKSLLIGLVLAEAELIASRHGGAGPLVLLDEVTAHLDEHRRGALFAEILSLRVQAWMTGTDLSSFAGIAASSTLFDVADGRIRRDGP
ncbi:MAG: DNA replication/repair protein RecF [Hyphomicrobiaceae bacterium]|nr:DNA replication/repair protein RecF [Hyphomicrobiaceae bacterium]